MKNSHTLTNCSSPYFIYWILDILTNHNFDLNNFYYSYKVALEYKANLNYL